MNIFETVKAAVPVRQAAAHYGLRANRSGMACCPFHNDRTPSMKLNEDYSTDGETTAQIEPNRNTEPVWVLEDMLYASCHTFQAAYRWLKSA